MSRRSKDFYQINFFLYIRPNFQILFSVDFECFNWNEENIKDEGTFDSERYPDCRIVCAPN